jgi:hypothetical protein
MKIKNKALKRLFCFWMWNAAFGHETEKLSQKETAF